MTVTDLGRRVYLESGKIANLVLLDANPLDNISNIKRIDAVILNGSSLSENSLADDAGKRRKGCEGKNELKQRTQSAACRVTERDLKAKCAHLFEKRFTSGGKGVIANATPLLSLPARTIIESEPRTDRV